MKFSFAGIFGDLRQGHPRGCDRSGAGGASAGALQGEEVFILRAGE